MTTENEEFDFDFEEEDEIPEDPLELAAAQNELEARCKEANFPVEQRESSPDKEKYLAVGIPCGREHYWIELHSLESFKSLLSIQFEKYIFVGNYLSICSYKDGSLEALIQSMTRFPSSILYRRLFGLTMEETRSRENIKGLTLQASDQEGSPKAILGNPSKELEVLAINRNAIGRRLSLRIENLTIKRYDDAFSILERVTNSLFYQIDLNINIPLSLARQRHYRRLENVQRSIESPEFIFPESEYDRAPIELYWYARSASGMPLLQYLAFYQTVEFYFPVYSQAESRRKIKNILKDPSFSPNRDADIGKVLTALKLGGGYGFGDERSQLKATLLECVNQDQLRSFLTLSEERKEFFTSKTKGLTEHKLSLNNQSADLRNEVSERIYDIRCKIVHTKNNASEGEVELLLPFSIESDLLYFDIELIQFIARQVLIAASSPLRI